MSSSLFGEMQSLVFIQISFLGEPSVSNITHKGLLTSVDPHVVNKVPCFVEEPPTVVVLADVVSEIPSTLRVKFVACGVLKLRKFGLLSFFHFESLWLVEEVVFLLCLQLFSPINFPKVLKLVVHRDFLRCLQHFILLRGGTVEVSVTTASVHLVVDIILSWHHSV